MALTLTEEEDERRMEGKCLQCDKVEGRGREGRVWSQRAWETYMNVGTKAKSKNLNEGVY